MRQHLPEYFIEAAALGLFMVVAAAGATVIEHPGSPVRQAIADPVARRMLMGAAMGLTVIAIVYSPWGARSGAHLNPALTFTFYRLGKVRRADAIAYVLAQLLGGIAGTVAAVWALGALVGVPEVNYVATVPGPLGVAAAFAGEVAIAFVQMSMVLHASSHPRLHRYTGLFAGLLVAGYITVEAPLSGMSLNPARSLGPAYFAAALDSFWIYLAAPTLGMLAAAELFVRRRGLQAVLCAKLRHGTRARCLFNCRFHEMPS